jgi:hypothetical protein
VTARPKEPTTRAGIISAGLVRVVATPAELDAAGGWWSAEKPGLDPADVKRARSEGMKAGLPRWLNPPVTPRQAVARMFRDAESERRAACEYIGGKVYTPPSQMTPTQLRAALGTQHRRLSGGWGDTGKTLDVVVAPPAPTQAVAIPEPTPVAAKAPRKPRRATVAPSAPVVVTAPEPEPTPEPVTVPELPAFLPELVTVAVINEILATEPEPVAAVAVIPAPEPEPVPAPPPAPIAAPARPHLPVVLPPEPRPEPTAPRKPAGRDRLAWVPLMARLAAKYAKQGYETRPRHRGTP